MIPINLLRRFCFFFFAISLLFPTIAYKSRRSMTFQNGFAKLPQKSLYSVKSSIRNDASISNHHKPYTAMMIVPTGIGASIGGYAGDALPSAKLLSSVVDILITHPNVMNAAMLYWPIDNILYVEGSTLNRFSNGECFLQPLYHRRQQKIGLLLDKGMGQELLLRHIQVAEGMRASLGIDIAHCVVTSQPVEITTEVSRESGASFGDIKNIPTLLDAAQKLKDLGCTAIAVVARFPEGEVAGQGEQDWFEAYRAGEGVDCIGGVEAILSHLITQRIQLPCAHAPAFLPMAVEAEVSPKACAEELGYTFLPCVLAYLRRTPNIISPSALSNLGDAAGLLSYRDVDAIVVPCNALGGPAVLSFLSKNNPNLLVLAVQDNLTAMQVDPSVLPSDERIVMVRSYAEAAGLLVAHKQGILREALTPMVPALPITYL